MSPSWKDGLQPASYRGVAFKVMSHEFSGGRRGAVQEFPQREASYVEDLGRVAQKFQIRALLIGDDYMAQRDRLIAACTTRGSRFRLAGGILKHPYLGDVRVLCLAFRLREASPEGRMARVDMDFVEVGQAPVPKRRTSVIQESQEAAAAVSDRGEAFAGEEMDSTGPESVRESIAGELRKTGNKIASLNVFSGPALEVALLAADVDKLITEATALAKAPADAASQVRQAIGRIGGAVARTADAIFAYEALFALEPDQIGGKGGTGKQADKNALSIINLVQEISVAELSAALATNTWESRDEALVHRAELIEKLEVVLETDDPDLQNLLSRVLSLAGAAIPPVNQRLPRILTIELPADTPSLVLAYQLYDDIERDQEVADRVGARRPGFIPGGVPLSVLSND